MFGRRREAIRRRIAVHDQQEGSSAEISFERDIRPLIRSKDRSSMLRAFDLWSHTDVVAHQDAILDQLRTGQMPCDGAWPADRVAVFSRWVDGGSLP
jgi:hypothetical protein